ncbi:hypothetical protein VNO77_46177 [Canavalia gladiata]|uniref:Uncharacterized protein n=1 Tax=Canavalia gladiata TaxID=3824 RepID=A0AAN9JJB3_CANGL
MQLSLNDGSISIFSRIHRPTAGSILLVYGTDWITLPLLRLNDLGPREYHELMCRDRTGRAILSFSGSVYSIDRGILLARTACRIAIT